MTIRRWILSALACAVLLVSQPAAANEKVTIAQFGQAKFLLYLPLYIAMEENLFARRGIDVDLKFAGNDDQIFASVLGGSADFGMGDPVFVAIAREKGGPGKVVAMMITRLGLSGYTNKPDVPEITDPKQLDKLRVSSFPEPSTTYTLLSQLKKDHAPNMKIVQAAFGAQLATLEAGDTDIAVDLEPTVSVAEDKGYRVVFDFEKYNSQQQAITGIMTMDNTIKTKPQTVQKVVTALQEAMNLLHTDPDVPLRVSKKLFPDMKESVLKAAIARMLVKDMYPKSIIMNGDFWQRTLKTRMISGELKAPQATEVSVDNSFAVRALAEAGAVKK